MVESHLTERQAKWFATVRANFERDSGKTLEEWVAIARTCPETGHRARLAWFKEKHGLLQNHATYVLREAFGHDLSWDQPDQMLDALWKNPKDRAIFEAVRACVSALDGVVMGPRKSFTAFSRKVQFAAMRPAAKGGALLGLAVEPAACVRLTPRGKSESWAEKLHASLALAAPDEVDDEVGSLLRQAWERG
jgi:hypothetical protein